ncbi:MAG: dihydrodipicolinate synthase family protein [Kiritimatiellae bacterium]|nr:dihydrodipicolinate synthase family protein [Kiritimatiellia bacterium]
MASILNKLFSDRAEPILIAVGGPGGTGKSTLCRHLSAELGNAAILTLDDYKTARESRQNRNIYGPHPDANKISLIHEHLTNLKKGTRFDKPVYCSNKGDAPTTEPFNPARFNIIDGEVSTYHEFRDLVDFSIFIDSDWTTQLQTRVSRDVKERGYSKDKAIATFLHSNLREFTEFGAESKKWADIHVHCHADYRLELESIAEEHFGILKNILPEDLEPIKIEGLIVPPCTPFDDNGNIDERAFVEHLEYLAVHGVTRLLINGTTAEFSSLLPTERRTLLAVSRRYFSGIIMFNTGSDSLAQAKEAAKWGEDYGVDAIVAMPPYYYSNAGEEALIKFFNELHNSVDIPMVIYNFPKHTGNVITPNILRNVKHIAVKDSAKDSSLIPATPCYLAGTSSRIPECMAMGAKGVVSARACCMPKIYVGLESALAAGETDKIKSFQEEIQARSEMFISPNEIACIKHDLATQIPNYPTTMRLPLLATN